jgi:hypothetical protein
MPFHHIDQGALDTARNTISQLPDAPEAPEPSAPRRADDARDGLAVLAIAVLIWLAVRALMNA